MKTPVNNLIIGIIIGVVLLAGCLFIYTSINDKFESERIQGRAEGYFEAQTIILNNICSGNSLMPIVWIENNQTNFGEVELSKYCEVANG